LDTQVNDRPSTSSVTCQTAAGNLGWRMRTCEPAASGPPSRRSTDFIDVVHDGQSSSAISTFHTTDAGASIATSCSTCTRPTLLAGC
jgi:hypothetical protein